MFTLTPNPNVIINCQSNLYLTESHYFTYISTDTIYKKITDSKIKKVCLQHILMRTEMYTKALYNKLLLNDVIEVQNKQYEDKTNILNLTLALKMAHCLYKFKFMGIANDNAPVYCIGISNQNFADVIKLIKTAKYNIPKGEFKFNNKIITNNDQLDKCGFSQNMNIIELVNVVQKLDTIESKMENVVIEEKKEKKSKKLTISKPKKIEVWNKYVTEEVGSTKCYCCKTNKISQQSYSCGHVISEHHGGTLDVANLRPICAPCNSSMGTKNMVEFMKEQKFGDLVN
jgi:hypothetical protein